MTENEVSIPSTHAPIWDTAYKRGFVDVTSGALSMTSLALIGNWTSHVFITYDIIRFISQFSLTVDYLPVGRYIKCGRRGRH